MQKLKQSRAYLYIGLCQEHVESIDQSALTETERNPQYFKFSQCSINECSNQVDTMFLGSFNIEVTK